MTVSVRRPRKLHFQKTQTLDLHHVELVTGRPSLVDSGTYSVAGLTGDDDARRVGGGMAAACPSTFSEVSIRLMYLIVGVVQRL